MAGQVKEVTVSEKIKIIHGKSAENFILAALESECSNKLTLRMQGMILVQEKATLAGLESCMSLYLL